jgi:hypothetical protein
MEAIQELIRRYGLDEDREHVIIPFTGQDGKVKRCFLLKRRFMRIVYPDGQEIDYPLAEVIEATIKYPELLLSEALARTQGEAVAASGYLSRNQENHDEKTDSDQRKIP